MCDFNVIDKFFAYIEVRVFSMTAGFDEIADSLSLLG